jgi:hypothetical protein
MKELIAVLLAFCFALPTLAVAGKTYVTEYTRKDGTYVAPYY